VALLILGAAMELAGSAWKRPDIRAAAGWLLALSAAAAFAAAFDGWLLAWSGGYRGRDVTRHMWGGVWLAGICAAAFWARPRPPGSRIAGAAYGVLLAVAVGLMLWTGHWGGSLSHGDDFLTAKMPAGLRALLGVKAPPAPVPGAPLPQAATPAPGPPPAGVKPGTHLGLATIDPANPAFYRLHIEPLFVRSCIACHKPEKHKGGLRMDSYALLMRGGDNGAEIVPGDPKGSEIVRRLTLPPSDDDSMPSDGEKPLTPEEIQMIVRWIAAGAKSG
jgi:hypothetical protein